MTAWGRERTGRTGKEESIFVIFVVLVYAESDGDDINDGPSTSTRTQEYKYRQRMEEGRLLIEDEERKGIKRKRARERKRLMRLFLDTRRWAEADAILWHAPGLSGVACAITTHRRDDDANGSGREEYDGNRGDGDGGDEWDGTTTRPLINLHRSLVSAVEIVRSGPSLIGLTNRMSYEFRLARSMGRFPEFK